MPAFCLFWRNLSNLNLGGEISTAVGDLRNLQSMYAFYIWFFSLSNSSLLIYMVQIFRGISWLVKFLMRSATVHLSVICNLLSFCVIGVYRFFFFLLFISVNAHHDDVWNAGICQITCFMDPFLFRSSSNWSSCQYRFFVA